MFQKDIAQKEIQSFNLIPNGAVSIHNPWNDGADDKHPNIYSLASLHYLNGWSGSNYAAANRFIKTLGNREVNFTEIWFPAYDRFGHTIKSDDKLKRKYMQFDNLVGKIAKGLEDKSQLDETLIILLADHSMSEVKENVNPNLICYDAGFRPKIARRKNNYDCMVLAYGYGVGQIYMKDKVEKEKLEERIQLLLEEESVEHVILKEGNKRIVYSQSSTVEISIRDDQYQMIILDGTNPFDYSDSLCQKLSQLHTARESLELTCNEEQPDAIVGTAESMHHPNSPSLRFLASEGYAFGKIRNYVHWPAWINSNRVRSHGTLHRTQSQVPLVIAGPEIIEPKVIQTARNIDWMPTFLELAGYEVPSDIDGQSLLHL
jgi:arylsulfatase A-like enzyme